MTDSTVKALYPENYAKDTITIYQGAIDPDNNGVFDTPETLTEHLNLYVPLDYKGQVTLDWEGAGIAGLETPIGSPIHQQTVEQYVLAIQAAKALRPNAKFGFYGLPIGRYYDRNQEWIDNALALQPIFDASDCLFPSIYDLYKSNESPQHDPQIDLEVTTDCTKLALRVANGKPVFPYIYHRYHDSNATWGFILIADDEMADNAKAAFDAVWEGDKADGMIWWGADQYYLWMSQQNYSPSHPNYDQSQRWQDVFAAEIPSGMTGDEWFTQLHTHILTLLGPILHDIEIPANN
jgi:hypothetical protein